MRRNKRGRLQSIPIGRVPVLPSRDQIETPTASARIGGRRGMEIRRRFLAAHPLCAMCDALGLVTAATEVDHIVPLWAGGHESQYDYRNKQGLCRRCHVEKSNADLEKYAKGNP